LPNRKLSASACVIFLIGTLFALVLLIPKILHARRNPRSWMLFRIFLAVAGAALVIAPLGAWSSYAPAVLGLTMFISAILLPPAKPESKIDNTARALGVLVVVNGGKFKLGDASSSPRSFSSAPATFPCATRVSNPFWKSRERNQPRRKPKNPTTLVPAHQPGRTKLQSSPIAVFSRSISPRRRDHHPQRTAPRPPGSPAPRRGRLILFSPLSVLIQLRDSRICVTLYPWHAAGKARTSKRRSKAIEAPKQKRIQGPKLGTLMREEQNREGGAQYAADVVSATRRDAPRKHRDRRRLQFCSPGDAQEPAVVGFLRLRRGDFAHGDFQKGLETRVAHGNVAGADEKAARRRMTRLPA